jgi:hypothetical protein
LLLVAVGIWIEQPSKPTLPIWLNTNEEKQAFHETLMFFLVTLLEDLRMTDFGVPNFLDYVGDK